MAVCQQRRRYRRRVHWCELEPGSAEFAGRSDKDDVPPRVSRREYLVLLAYWQSECRRDDGDVRGVNQPIRCQPGLPAHRLAGWLPGRWGVGDGLDGKGHAGRSAPTVAARGSELHGFVRLASRASAEPLSGARGATVRNSFPAMPLRQIVHTGSSSEHVRRRISNCPAGACTQLPVNGTTRAPRRWGLFFGNGLDRALARDNLLIAHRY